ncbi:MAG: hypothetical protein A2516_11645 [Alphaproteobacteria bacterium RIFOXYD12_FULL_60_8]|nr:MAG: hypothetical protein A2516_11645 [Alphaproteobacteria bacterium RIFOXYD12_FULL_60_8]
MKFIASKVLWFLVSPGNVLLLALCLGAMLLWTRWSRMGRRVIAVTALGALLIGTVPVGQWLLVSLENRFPPAQELPSKVDGIISLGGVLNQFIAEARGQTSLSSGAGRLTEMMILSRRYPDAKLVFTGGSGDLMRPEIKEAQAVELFFKNMGFESGKVIFENQSRNTHENAVYSKALVSPKPGETWLLITSAFHMPRSVGVFRAAGWEVVPYPVDFSTEGRYLSPPMFDFQGGLSGLTKGLHEWLGLVAYRAMGRTESVFPSP